MPASGDRINDKVAVLTRGDGAEVVAVNVETEFPLPEPICDGLKPHVVAAGKPEQDKVTLLGNVPVFGLTSTV